ADVSARLVEWGPAQGLGDVFVRFCSGLKTYSNFFNNYSLVLKTVDKCRDVFPNFRAFLGR
uniref:DH domain-containing protein n=2 Tax=Callorhinchus milii TaxID=7868 RepID=A0A4W3GBX9_CALMI